MERMGETGAEYPADWYRAVASEYSKLLDTVVAVFKRRPSKRAAEDVAGAVDRFREAVRLEELTHDAEGRPLGAMAADAIDRIEDFGADVRAKLQEKTGQENTPPQIGWLRGAAKGRTLAWLKRRELLLVNLLRAAERDWLIAYGVDRHSAGWPTIIAAVVAELREPPIEGPSNGRSYSRSATDRVLAGETLETRATKLLYEVYVDPEVDQAPIYEDFVTRLHRAQVKPPE
jgi:hypothetical protein